jgi:hypothetical protein
MDILTELAADAVPLAVAIVFGCLVGFVCVSVCLFLFPEEKGRGRVCSRCDHLAWVPGSRDHLRGRDNLLPRKAGRLIDAAMEDPLLMLLAGSSTRAEMHEGLDQAELTWPALLYLTRPASLRPCHKQRSGFAQHEIDNPAAPDVQGPSREGQRTPAGPSRRNRTSAVQLLHPRGHALLGSLAVADG